MYMSFSQLLIKIPNTFQWREKENLMDKIASDGMIYMVMQFNGTLFIY